MGGTWSTVEPTLPSGAVWSEAIQSETAEDETIRFRFELSVVRLNRQQVCCRCATYSQMVRGSMTGDVQYRSVDDGVDSDKFYINVSTFGWTLNAYRYYTVDAAPGDTIGIRMYAVGDSTNAVNVAAPGYLLPEMYVKVNGAVKRLEGVYVNVGGASVPVESIKFNGG